MDGYLTSEATWRGRFWIPGQPEQEQRGILSFTPDRGVVLTLIGGFDDAVWLPRPSGGFVMSDRSREWSVIHGEVAGKPVTLIDCIASHSTSYLMSAHVEEQEVVAERALLGVSINDEDAQVFSAVKIELENLTEWDYRADVVHEIERDQSLPRGSRWRIAVDPVTSLTVEVDDVTVELGRWYRLPSHDLRRNRLASATFAVSQVTVRSMTPRSVAEWIDTVQVFQDLLTLAMGAPCGVLKQTLRSRWRPCCPSP